jgi:hypothetical protein
LNQNEYALTFALPADPYPNDPAHDLAFERAADFPRGRRERALARRSLREFALGRNRSGRARVRARSRSSAPAKSVIDGLSYGPSGVSPQLVANRRRSGAGRHNARIACARRRARRQHGWSRSAFETSAAGGTTYVSAIDLDGELSTSSPCVSNPFELAMWDVTDAQHPVKLATRRFASDANRRSRIPFELALEPGRQWRCVAHVARMRETQVARADRSRPRARARQQRLHRLRALQTVTRPPLPPLDPTRVYLSVLFHE